MENNNNKLQVRGANIQAPSHLDKELFSKQPEEVRKIINVKYFSPRFNRYGEEDLHRMAQILLYRISVITGWEIPADKTYQDVLTSELVEKMKDDYGDINHEEVLYAVRNFSRTEEDFGKALNIQIIDKIINKYRERRAQISMEEERMIPVTQRIFTQFEMDEYNREAAEWAYQMFLSGISNKHIENCRQILLNDKLINDSQTVAQFFRERASQGFLNVYKKQ